MKLLKNLLISTGKKDFSKISILDVAAGTGIVGEGLAKEGFKNIPMEGKQPHPSKWGNVDERGTFCGS